MVGYGRLTMVTDIITFLDSAVVGTYPNLGAMSTANIKYAAHEIRKVHSILTKNRKLVLVGVGRGEAPALTIGAHQEFIQGIEVAVFVLGSKMETDDKLSITLAEEVEDRIWNNLVLPTGKEVLQGLKRFDPYIGDQGSQVIHAVNMEFTNLKLGTLGV